MITRFLKRFAQKQMMSSSPDSFEAEMNTAAVENLDFRGLDSGGRTPEERTEAVLSAMNPEEKIDYITGYRSLGIRAMDRHGLPSVWMSDATSGVRSYGPVTAFPAGVAMAASWDRKLIAEAADHIAEAARAKGISILLGPGVNIARVPTCGRNFEYLGEDPFLAGEMAAAYIRACSERDVICTVKHLAANNSDYDRHKVSSDMDERTLREIYLPAFETAVKKGGSKGLMSAYNPVNGIWASENRFLLTEVLREEWGYDGFVVSDWTSLYSTAGPLHSGLDLEMPGPKWLTRDKVRKAIESGRASEADLDRMAGNVLRTLFAAGVYDRPVKDETAREFAPEHDEAAIRAAAAGAVLLKNDGGALPLPEGPGVRIAVCGPHGVKTPTMGGGSCHIARTTGTVGLLDGLRTAAADGTDVTAVTWRRSGRLTRAEKRTIAAADAVVIACGFDYVEESELYDRPWRLPDAQRRLIREVSAISGRTAVILTAGGGVETQSWIDGIGAAIHGMYLGQSVGTALARLLLGRENFRGKLPFSMAKNWTDIPAAANYPRRFHTTSPGRMTLGQGKPRFRRMRRWRYAEGLMVGYRHFDTAGVEPAFPFGHGLSYTSFVLADIRLSSPEISAGESPEVSLTVRNTGKRAGHEVVQVYVKDLESSLPRPEKELKGFEVAAPAPGESTDVVIPLPPESFRFWKPGVGWIIEPGDFEVLIGTGSRDIHAVLKVTITA